MLGANGKAKADEIVAYLTAQGIIKDGQLQSDKILNPNPDYATNANIKESALFKLSFSSLGISGDVEYKLKEKLAKFSQVQSKDYAAQSENLKQNTSNTIKHVIGDAPIIPGSIREKAVLEIMQALNRLIKTYGGTESEWVKKTSDELNRRKLIKGLRAVQIHWYENINTGQKVEFKIKEQ